MTNCVVIGLQAACLFLSGKCGVFHVISASLEWSQPGCFCRTALRPDPPCLLPPMHLSAVLEALWVRDVWSPKPLGCPLPIGHCLPPFSIESILFSQFVQLNVQGCCSSCRGMLFLLFEWLQNTSESRTSLRTCAFNVLVLTAQLLEAVSSADGPAPPPAVYLFILVSQVWPRSWLQFSDLGNPCGCLASLFSLLSWLHVGDGPGESGSLSRLFLVDLPRIAILHFHCACCQMSFCYCAVHVLW